MAETAAEYNAKIIAEFRASAGRVGGPWESIRCCCSTTPAQSRPGLMSTRSPTSLTIRATSSGRQTAERRSSGLVSQPQDTPGHGDRGRERNHQCRGRGDDRHGPRPAVCTGNRSLSAASRCSPEDRSRYSHPGSHAHSSNLSFGNPAEPLAVIPITEFVSLPRGTAGSEALRRRTHGATQ